MTDKHGIAMTLNNIGLLYHNNKKYKKAQDYYSQSLIIKKEIADLHGEAMTLNNIGLTYEMQKNTLPQ
ncbi:MAG: tetratricopeptide repeat protein [Flavobacteriales bacterium]|nr:tetratricopeptide repeat protein [Flavobacteriales bacterium]